MSGRIYKLRRVPSVRRFNCFTYTDYNSMVKEITQVNRPAGQKNVYVWVKKKTDLSPIMSLVNDVLNWNDKPAKTKEIFTTTKPYKLKFHFKSYDEADEAADLIRKMTVPDQITESRIHTDGSVVSKEGLNVKVEVVENEDGTKSAAQGGTFVNTESTGTVETDETETGTPWARYALIAGIAIVAIIASVWYFKKKK